MGKGGLATEAIEVGLAVANFPPVIHPQQVGHHHLAELVKELVAKQGNVNYRHQQHPHQGRIQASETPPVKTNEVDRLMLVPLILQLVSDKVTRNQQEEGHPQKAPW